MSDHSVLMSDSFIQNSDKLVKARQLFKENKMLSSPLRNSIQHLSELEQSLDLMSSAGDSHHIPPYNVSGVSEKEVKADYRLIADYKLDLYEQVKKGAKIPELYQQILHQEYTNTLKAEMHNRNLAELHRKQKYEQKMGMMRMRSVLKRVPKNSLRLKQLTLDDEDYTDDRFKTRELETNPPLELLGEEILEEKDEEEEEENGLEEGSGNDDWKTADEEDGSDVSRKCDHRHPGRSVIWEEDEPEEEISYEEQRWREDELVSQASKTPTVEYIIPLTSDAVSVLLQDEENEEPEEYPTEEVNRTLTEESLSISPFDSPHESENSLSYHERREAENFVRSVETDELELDQYISPKTPPTVLRLPRNELSTSPTASYHCMIQPTLPSESLIRTPNPRPTFPRTPTEPEHLPSPTPEKYPLRGSSKDETFESESLKVPKRSSDTQTSNMIAEKKAANTQTEKYSLGCFSDSFASIFGKSRSLSLPRSILGSSQGPIDDVTLSHENRGEEGHDKSTFLRDFANVPNEAENASLTEQEKRYSCNSQSTSHASLSSIFEREPSKSLSPPFSLIHEHAQERVNTSQFSIRSSNMRSTDSIIPNPNSNTSSIPLRGTPKIEETLQYPPRTVLTPSQHDHSEFVIRKTLDPFNEEGSFIKSSFSTPKSTIEHQTVTRSLVSIGRSKILHSFFQEPTTKATMSDLFERMRAFEENRNDKLIEYYFKKWYIHYRALKLSQQSIQNRVLIGLKRNISLSSQEEVERGVKIRFFRSWRLHYRHSIFERKMGQLIHQSYRSMLIRKSFEWANIQLSHLYLGHRCNQFVYEKEQHRLQTLFKKWRNDSKSQVVNRQRVFSSCFNHWRILQQTNRVVRRTMLSKYFRMMVNLVESIRASNVELQIADSNHTRALITKHFKMWVEKKKCIEKKNCLIPHFKALKLNIYQNQEELSVNQEVIMRSVQEYVFRKWRMKVLKKNKERVALLVRMYFLRSRTFSKWIKKCNVVTEKRKTVIAEENRSKHVLLEAAKQFNLNRSVVLKRRVFFFWKSLQLKEINERHTLLEYRRMLTLKSMLGLWRRRWWYQKKKTEEKYYWFFSWRQAVSESRANKYHRIHSITKVFWKWNLMLQMVSEDKLIHSFRETHLVRRFFLHWRDSSPLRKEQGSFIFGLEINRKIQVFSVWKSLTIVSVQHAAADSFRDYNILKTRFNQWKSALHCKDVMTHMFHFQARSFFTAFKLGIQTMRHEKQTLREYFQWWTISLVERENTIKIFEKQMNRRQLAIGFNNWRQDVDRSIQARVFYRKTTVIRCWKEWKERLTRKQVETSLLEKTFSGLKQIYYEQAHIIPVIKLFFNRWRKLLQCRSEIEHEGETVLRKLYFSRWFSSLRKSCNRRISTRYILLRAYLQSWQERTIWKIHTSRNEETADDFHMYSTKKIFFKRMVKNCKDVLHDREVCTILDQFRKKQNFNLWLSKVNTIEEQNSLIVQFRNRRDAELLKRIVLAWKKDHRNKMRVTACYKTFVVSVTRGFFESWKERYLISMKTKFVEERSKKWLKMRCILWWKQRQRESIQTRIKCETIRKYWDAWKLFVEYQRYRKIRNSVKHPSKGKRKKSRVKMYKSHRDSERTAQGLLEKDVQTSMILNSQGAQLVEPITIQECHNDSDESTVKKMMQENDAIPQSHPPGAITTPPESSSEFKKHEELILSPMTTDIMKKPFSPPTQKLSEALSDLQILFNSGDPNYASHLQRVAASPQIKKQLQKAFEDYDMIDPFTIHQRMFEHTHKDGDPSHTRLVQELRY